MEKLLEEGKCGMDSEDARRSQDEDCSLVGNVHSEREATNNDSLPSAGSTAHTASSEDNISTVHSVSFSIRGRRLSEPRRASITARRSIKSQCEELNTGIQDGDDRLKLRIADGAAWYDKKFVEFEPGTQIVERRSVINMLIELVSQGVGNERRDYVQKFTQFLRRGVDDFVIISPSSDKQADNYVIVCRVISDEKLDDAKKSGWKRAFHGNPLVCEENCWCGRKAGHIVTAEYNDSEWCEVVWKHRNRLLYRKIFKNHEVVDEVEMFKWLEPTPNILTCSKRMEKYYAQILGKENQLKDRALKEKEEAVKEKEEARLAEERAVKEKEEARLAEDSALMKKEEARLAEERAVKEKEEARLAEEMAGCRRVSNSVYHTDRTAMSLCDLGLTNRFLQLMCCSQRIDKKYPFSSQSSRPSL